MPTLYRVKSDNYWSAAAVGGVNQWIHIDAGQTNRVTIKRLANKPIVLCGVTVNSSGAAGALVLTDDAVGVIASLKASVAEKDYHYQISLRGNLLIDNNGSDLTVEYLRD